MIMCVNKKGFTLIELLVTIVIIGIVATIAVVSVTGVFRSTKDNISEVSQKQIDKAIELYLAQNYSDIKDDLNNGNEVNISTSDLREKNLIKGSIIDKDGIEIQKSYEVTTDASGNLVKGNETTNKYLNSVIKNSKDIKTIKDNDGTSYYYQGYNANNYIKIEGKIFRIIRVNGNGNIRLLTNSPVSSTRVSYSTLDTYSRSFKDWPSFKYSVDDKFCIDTYTSTIEANTDNLICDKSNIHNSKYGLMSVKEAMLSKENTSGPSYINSCTGIWCERMYLYSFHDPESRVYITNYNTSFLTNSTKIDYKNPNDSGYYAVFRFVMNISDETLFSKGDGTSSNPYEIVNS